MADMNSTLIKMEGVKKVFLTDEVETHALSEIHLEIHRGQYVSISGPSGCGKSTLLSILGLLDSPSEGNYLLNGQPVEVMQCVKVIRCERPEHQPRSADGIVGLEHRCSPPSRRAPGQSPADLDVRCHRRGGRRTARTAGSAASARDDWYRSGSR